MSSTHRPSLEDILPGLGGLSGRRAPGAVPYVQHRSINLSASGEVAILYARGPVRIREVIFIPDASIAASGTNYWQLKVINKGTNGSGASQLGTTFSTASSGLAAFDAASLYAPTSQVVVEKDQVLSLLATATGAPGALAGLVLVFYTPLLS